MPKVPCPRACVSATRRSVMKTTTAPSVLWPPNKPAARAGHFLPLAAKRRADRAPGMIEGHQGLISPVLTRNHETSIDYGSICSIYPVRFAVSGASVALLTRDHGPSTNFTRSRTVPELTQSWPARARAPLHRRRVPKLHGLRPSCARHAQGVPRGSAIRAQAHVSEERRPLAWRSPPVAVACERASKTLTRSARPGR